MSNKSLHSAYTKLKEFADILESDVKDSLKKFEATSESCSYDLEKAKDFHYSEILKNLQGLKQHLDEIGAHETQLTHLNSIKEFNETEKKRYSYVQARIQEFSRNVDNNDNIIEKTKRERRRSSDILSVKCLDAWEKFMKNNENDLEVGEAIKQVPMRLNRDGFRKKKKYVSSTFDAILEGPSVNSMISISEENEEINKNTVENVEIVIEEELNKPKVINMTYK